MKNNITSCYFILTENCNLRCTYCFENKTRCVNKNMSEEIAFKTIDYLFENAKKTKEDKVNITWFGGEPMLNVKLMRSMLHYIVDKQKETGTRARMQIITNSTIYNDEVEEFLEEWVKLTKGDIDIQLSVDGTPEIQNINRPCANKNLVSSELVEECIKKFQKFYDEHNISHKRLHIHTCISKASMPKLLEIYRYFTYQLKVNFKFAWVFEEPWDDNDVEIFDTQLNLIIREMFKANRSIDKYPFKRFDRCSGCSSGRRLVCVDTKGDIYPCHRFFFYNIEKRGEHILGNILNEVPIDEEKRQAYIDIDESQITIHPCQVCVAVNSEFGGDWKTLPNEYGIKFMEIMNKYYYMYEERDEKQKLMSCIDAMVKTINGQEERIKNLESEVFRLTRANNNDCKCKSHSHK